MTAADLSVAAVLAALAGSSYRQALRLWRQPGYVERLMLGSRILPFSQDFRRGAARGAFPLSIGVGLAAAGVLTFTIFRPPHGRVTGGAIAAVACFGLMLAAFALHFSIIWFNRPLWLVPPHMRADHGTIAAWLVRHRHGSQG